jgi:hypothetical protein
MIRYSFREPLTIKNAAKADPQKFGESLGKIAEANNGSLTPQAVVEAARNPRHVLHKHFEWDDATAAEAYRIEQARGIIRVIRVDDDDESRGSTRAFVSIAEKDGTSYRTVADVKSSRDLQAAYLLSIDRDLEALERRARALAEICPLLKSARKAVQKRLDALKGESRAAA